MLRTAKLWRPTPRQNPDEWAASNIVYPASSGVPGARDVRLTPYCIPFQRETVSGRWRRTVMVCGAQMGKTASFLDIIGERLDNRPAPILYVGPTEQFIEEQLAPRVTELFETSKSLGAKVSRAKRQRQALRYVAGVKLRLAHGGSSSALKSDPASVGFVDEYDEMLASVKGQGDPLGLVQARGFTYADFLTVVASTPGLGIADVERDDASGLEFWRRSDPDDIQSPIWALFQTGTMHHWAWPCPHCGAYFVPRMKNLDFNPEARPAQVRRDTVMICPNPTCKGRIIDSEHKAEMNARGLFVAYGQWIENGVVVGEPEDTDTFSVWISGLCSPFQSFGDRAAELVEQMQNGTPSKVQTATNAGFGELYSPGGGEVPEWQAVQQLKRPYSPMTCPAGVMVLTAAADVHKRRINVVVRGWGKRGTSWKIYSVALEGDTLEPDIWRELEEVLMLRFPVLDDSGRTLPIKIAFVDSGYRPGKPEIVPENMVYDFCRRHRRFVFPTKGASRPQRTGLVKSNIEVNYKAQGDKYGLELITLDTDVWKRWVHERIRWDPTRPGAWFLDGESDEDYARQLVSEARVKGANGKWTWVPRSKKNHWFDCETMNAAAGYLLGVQRIGLRQGEDPEEDPTDDERGDAPVTPAPAPVPVSAPVPPLAPAPVPGKTPGPAGDNPTANKFAMLSARMNKR